MAKKIIANFMSKTERDFAKQLINTDQETDSYLIGEATNEQISNLVKGGLIVEEVATKQPIEALNANFGSKNNFTRSGMKMSVINSDIPAEQQSVFYLIYLDVPLLEEYKKALVELDVVRIEFIPPNCFSARVHPDQVAAVKALPFVSDIHPLPTVVTSTVISPRGLGFVQQGQIKTFDIRLSGGADTEPILDLLRKENVLVVQARGGKVRIQMLEDQAIIDSIAAKQDVLEIEEFSPPKLYNDISRQLLGIDSTSASHLSTSIINQNGTGQIIAIADTGIDDSHPDFAGRIAGIVALGRTGDHTDPHGHGTHVAGSALGDGSSSSGKIKGTAPGAQLFFQSLLDSTGRLGGLPVNLSDLFEEAYLNGARIHNNSWGADTQSRYTFNSFEVDEYVAQRRDMLIVIAAGNEGNATANPRVSPGSVDWLSIGAPATAKNALAVGASQSSKALTPLSKLTYGAVWSANFPDPPSASELVSGDPSSMAEFSSRGPSDDERIKPDLTAPGTDILSTKSKLASFGSFWGSHTIPKYAYMGGTSMATPLIAGCAALVREYYTVEKDYAEPSAALIKATLINGTRMLSGRSATAEHAQLPNFHQGFGGADMLTTIPNSVEVFDLEFIDNWKDPSDQITYTGQNFQYSFILPQDGWLRICLAYTDAAGRSLQNDLNLTMQCIPNQGPSQKWVGNEDAVASHLLKTPDRKNNVEIIRIGNTLAGKYIVQVSAYNLFKVEAQDFALVVTAPSIQGFVRDII
jgi:subtilisin family serine protease